MSKVILSANRTVVERAWSLEKFGDFFEDVAITGLNERHALVHEISSSIF